LEGDFIFKGKMKVHALRGTTGAEVADDLKPEPTDVILVGKTELLKSKPA
jgi:hypothetical protein